MYKIKLQEMCQLRKWALPQYTSSREGPDHNPHFRASVTINGLTYNAPDVSKSSKEAQNNAAQIAVEHLAPPIPPPPPPQSPAGQISYKSQLQNFLTKKNVVPIYGCVREGPPHALRFKATIAIDGQTFESPEFHSTLREAEHAASKVALLALPPEENQQDESGFYKNLLQELAQKEGFSLPVYKTVIGGASHMPIFSSTVEIEGESFDGDVAKTKKQAEMNAARVAWCQLKERRARRVAAGLSMSGHMQNDFQPVSARSPSAIMDSKQPTSPSPSIQVTWVKIDAEKEYTSGKDQKNVLGTGNAEKSNSTSANAAKNLPEVVANREDSVDCASSEDGLASTSMSSRSNQFAEDKTCLLLRNRVRVYPRRPDFVLPEGTTLLPFSDDKWVAVSLDFSDHEGGV